MRIAFVGKGGSGKTTLSSLFGRYLGSLEKEVVMIDADINQHLGSQVGFDEQQLSQLSQLGDKLMEIKEYLRGDNERINHVSQMIKTTPPGRGSRLLRIDRADALLDTLSIRNSTIRLMATGGFQEEDLGVKCYHSKTGAVELLLNHLVDDRDEYVVVDMTAGADAFASGLFSKFDLTLLVVEPTLMSVGVYKQYLEYSKGFDLNIKVVGNKVESTEDEEFIKEYVGDNYLGSFGRSEVVRAIAKGAKKEVGELETDNLEILQKIKEVLDETTKDWQKFYEHSVFVHKRNALGWANNDAGADLTLQIDSQFDPVHFYKKS